MASAYKTGLRDIIAGSVSLSQAQLGVVLLDPGYTFNANSQVVADITDNELENLVGTGYRRKFLDDKEFTVDGSNVVFTAANIRYTDIETTENINSAVVYAQGANDQTSALLFHFPLPETLTVGSDIVIQFSNGEVIRLPIP